MIIFIFFYQFLFLFADKMVRQLSTGYYMILVLIDALIVIPVLFPMGIFFQKSREAEETISHLKSSDKNESKIFENILANCWQLEDNYSEFHAFSLIDLCQGYNFALKLFKLGLISSILYNIFLLNFLYNRLRGPISIICILLVVLFVLNLRTNTWMMNLFGLSFILLAYSMIFIHTFTNYPRRHYMDNNDRNAVMMPAG